MLRRKKIRAVDLQLLAACDALNTVAVRAAVAAGANVNIIDPETGMMPLDIVAEFAPVVRHFTQFREPVEEIVAVLLVHGAAPEGAMASTGETPFAQFSRYDPRGPVCRMLLAAVADCPANIPDAMAQERL